MCWLISGTGERTSVAAFSILLRCRLSSFNRLEKFLNAFWIANNLGCSTVEDRCCPPNYRLSVHRNVIKRCLPVALLTKSVSALNEQCFGATADLNG